MESKVTKLDVEIQNEKTEKGDPHKLYDYEEAIELAGNGSYNIGLLLTLSMTMAFMAIDMFGMSVLVTGCSCDFQLDQRQKNILVSMPFLGAILMAYPWGYISDTQGRRKSLIIAMFGSFIASTIGAFSPNWIFLAVFKLVSCSFCSCAQSVAYALLGETCGVRIRGTYMLIMTSIFMFGAAIMFGIGYPVLNLDFTYDLGFIRFLPWRLLTLIYALVLGINGVLLTMFYESPKFVLNARGEEEALEILGNIYRRNGGRLKDYPVMRLTLEEVGNTKLKEMPLMKSLWEQLAPLFRPPLLLKSLQLYYLTAVTFITNNGFVMWFPLIADTFFTSISSSNTDQPEGLCNIISQINNSTSATYERICIPKIQLLTALAMIGHSFIMMVLNLCISKMASRKKLMVILVGCVSASSGIGSVLVENNAVSFVMFMSFLTSGLQGGFLFSYFVDLYPTSYRGMAVCLCSMVARFCSLSGTNITGTFVLDHCSTTIYCWCALLTSGIVVSFFLPADRKKV